jgi:uncharacterized membrane protein YhiD involved in acid resistance
MFDFSGLSNNLEGSSITNVIIIALLAFVLSSFIAFIYERTSQGIETPRYFIQSLILISIPVAMVMQAIGDSLARGLGMLGALAIIRFRTTLRNPRNMVFMFTSIAIGISTGIYGIGISVVGTLGFGLVVLAIQLSPLSKEANIVGYLQFEIFVNEFSDGDYKKLTTNLLQTYCKKNTLNKYAVNTKRREELLIEIISFEYKIKVENKKDSTTLVNELSKQKGIKNVKINFKDDYEQI